MNMMTHIALLCFTIDFGHVKKLLLGYSLSNYSLELESGMYIFKFVIFWHNL